MNVRYTVLGKMQLKKYARDPNAIYQFAKKFPISRTLLGLPVYQSKKLFQNLFPY